MFLSVMASLVKLISVVLYPFKICEDCTFGIRSYDFISTTHDLRCIVAGGQTIQDECEKFVKKHGPLHEGKVMVSGAGHLQCTYIFHAVGPVWRGGHSGLYEFTWVSVKFQSLKL